MTLTKKKMVREIGRRTRLTNREVQEVVETLVDVWTEALVAGEKIEIQNFFVLEVKMISRSSNSNDAVNGIAMPNSFKKVNLRMSKRAKKLLNQQVQIVERRNGNFSIT